MEVEISRMLVFNSALTQLITQKDLNTFIWHERFRYYIREAV
jgi:hypothetical protein